MGLSRRYREEQKFAKRNIHKLNLWGWVEDIGKNIRLLREISMNWTYGFELKISWRTDRGGAWLNGRTRHHFVPRSHCAPVFWYVDVYVTWRWAWLDLVICAKIGLRQPVIYELESFRCNLVHRVWLMRPNMLWRTFLPPEHGCDLCT